MLSHPPLHQEKIRQIEYYAIKKKPKPAKHKLFSIKAIVKIYRFLIKNLFRNLRPNRSLKKPNLKSRYFALFSGLHCIK